MLFTRFIKFLNSIYKTNKPAVKFLLSVTASDVRSVTGSNLRSILVNTGVQVIPGTTKAYSIKKQRLFKVPEPEKWKVPLLHSLLAVRAGEFEISFDDENIDGDYDENFDGADDEAVEDNMTDDILANICTSRFLIFPHS